MDFRVLGPLEVRDSEGPIALGGTKQRAVLAHLLLRDGTLVPAERLIDEVWDDAPPAAVRNVLQTYVSRLRKALGSERLEHGSGGYVLHADPGEIDARRFEALTTEARRAAATDPERAVDLYREADALWRGGALDDLADQPSLRPAIAHLEELRLAAVQERIVAELALGRHADLVPELEALTAQHPLREALWGHLMTALYRAGRQADALAAYHRARGTLIAELGIEPSAHLRRVEAQVLRQDPALDLSDRPLRGFRLLERVGEGAFGVVHRALQPQVGRDVAIKVIRPELADDPEFIRRFEAEAQLVARLEHPHVVPLYDYWREPGGAYLVMRYLRGGSLRDALEDGPLARQRGLAVAEHIASALAAAHRQGVVHRDVKPGNVLLDEEGNAYLSDFGIARDIVHARTPARVHGGTSSSAAYMSPEEARGEEPTARADVYSLGLVLSELFGGDVSGGIAEVVRRSTLADPAERYPDAAALLAALVADEHAVTAPAGPVRNPYKGLRPFLEGDARDFHGRADLVARLTQRLTDERLLALVGPSGSGKSSVVHAGLIPELRAKGWFVASIHPGTDPDGELAAALGALAPSPPPAGLDLADAASWVLPDHQASLLLVIDQFEELFTLTGEAERGAFLDALSRAVADPRDQVRVVLTLRADALGGPLARAGFAEILRAGTELVLPLRAEELEQAITGPAAGAGVEIETGLVGALIADVIDRPGALPLLQFALAELFDRRDGNRLTLAAYRDLGGVAAAVARGAEAAYAALDEPGRATAHQLFLRLVEPGAGRRRVTRAELLALAGDAAAMAPAIDAFGARRLLGFDRDPDTREPTVEIAHEALIGAWERLRDWLAEADEDLRTRRVLASAAGEWAGAERDPSFLLRGSRLERIAEWSAGTSLALTADERAFVAASVAERDRRRDEAEAGRARERELERRSVRRLRALVVVLAAAGLAAVALTAFAFDQRSDADAQRRTAVARGLAAAAVANVDEDAERSVLLALEAVEHSRGAGGSVLPEAEEALHRAVISSRITLRVPRLGGALDWSPDGELFVTEGPEETGRIDVRDARTGETVRAFHGHDVDVNLVEFDPASERLASSGDDGRVNVWDPRTGARLRSFRGEGEVWGLSFSPDGRRLAAAWWEEGAVRVFDLPTERRLAEVTGLDASFATAFSPDGERLAISTFTGGAVLVDARTGRRVGALEGQGGVSDVEWSPDGRRIATTSLDSTVRIWDARSGRSRFTLSGHADEVVAADWSADSRRLVTGGRDGRVKVWVVDRDEAREELSFPAQERGGGLWVAFSPDGQRVMTGDEGITAVKVWDVGAGGGAEWANLPAAPGQFGGVAFAPTGAVATGRPDGSVAVHDPASGRRTATLPAAPGATGAGAIDVSDDGLVAAAGGEVVRVWDPADRRAGFTVEMPDAVDVAWSSDGSRLAVARGAGAAVLDREGDEVAAIDVPGYRVVAADFGSGRLLALGGFPEVRRGGGGETSVWDWERRRPVVTVPTATFGVALTADGRLLATAPPSGPPEVWDARTGERVARLTGHTGAVNAVAFAPDGARVATGGADATVRLWDARTGRQELVLRGHEALVTQLAFSADGRRLVSTGPDGVARVWALDLDDLVAIARRGLTRSLTAQECAQYLRHRSC